MDVGSGHGALLKLVVDAGKVHVRVAVIIIDVFVATAIVDVVVAVDGLT